MYKWLFLFILILVFALICRKYIGGNDLAGMYYTKRTVCLTEYIIIVDKTNGDGDRGIKLMDRIKEQGYQILHISDLDNLQIREVDRIYVFHTPKTLDGFKEIPNYETIGLQPPEKYTKSNPLAENKSDWENWENWDQPSMGPTLDEGDLYDDPEELYKKLMNFPSENSTNSEDLGWEQQSESITPKLQDESNPALEEKTRDENSEEYQEYLKFISGNNILSNPLVSIIRDRNFFEKHKQTFFKSSFTAKISNIVDIYEKIGKKIPINMLLNTLIDKDIGKLISLASYISFDGELVKKLSSSKSLEEMLDILTQFDIDNTYTKYLETIAQSPMLSQEPVKIIKTTDFYKKHKNYYDPKTFRYKIQQILFIYSKLDHKISIDVLLDELIDQDLDDLKELNEWMENEKSKNKILALDERDWDTIIADI